MCRVLMYLGESILADNLLYKPDSSLIKQSYQARFMSRLNNLAGFGMTAWDKDSCDNHLPFVYKTAGLPFYDQNLKRLATKIQANCLLAHIRGVPFNEREIVSEQNVHPFIYDNFRISLAHNGNLMHFSLMKYDLLKFIQPDIAKYISGTTDSEWIYALFLSQLKHPQNEISLAETITAVRKTLTILSNTRKKHNINTASPVNLFITNGKYLVATRFVFNFGCYANDYDNAHLSNMYNSLWYTYGQQYRLHDGEYKMMAGKQRASVIIASEPLTEDTTTWIEAPEYSLITAHLDKGEVQIATEDIEF